MVIYYYQIEQKEVLLVGLDKLDIEILYILYFYYSIFGIICQTKQKEETMQEQETKEK